eukprot:CAMPEP_0196782036 /NCGR_PEP_ID=MMETSP1104-20130614/10568_1 /TAXON_ID=33652 /ORGANISM="Cafeteria sp., Strain Caron Lab Isolate" /LENGTH=306 /DNA_ID=CAMNT_0042152267 /DNA_START=1 /DNA_END=921 /DNA_ORIENTATION=+
MTVASSFVALVERVLLVGMVLHIALLSYLVMQPSDQTQATLARVFGTVSDNGTVVVEKAEYGVKCDYRNVEHIIANLDIYYLEHLVGWVIGGFVLRSIGGSFLYSLAWEMVEWEFQFVFRVFKECWWDKIILDAMLGNGLGILVGALVSRALKFERYHWFVRGHSLRSLLFLSANYIFFSYGALTLYAFNDAVEIPEFHPFVFYLLVGSVVMMLFTYEEHYDHFIGKRVTFKWRILSVVSITLTFATAWHYGLKNYNWVMPDMWLEGLLATIAIYIVIFFGNITLRNLPDMDWVRQRAGVKGKKVE